MGGDIDISSLNDLSLTGSQTGSTESFQDVATTVDNEVTQSAAATVEGVNSCLAIIAVVINRNGHCSHDKNDAIKIVAVI